MRRRRIAALLGIMLLLAQLWAAPASGLEPERLEGPEQTEEVPEPQEPEKPETVSSWQVSLPGGLVVEAGACVDYLTVAAGLLPEPAGGYYPGGLTIETDGQIVVRAGGSLTIGKFAIGSAEPSPVLRGTLREDGLIRVEAGGRLTLNGVTLETAGEGGCVLWQEDGGLVELHDTDLAGSVRWGAPVVDNTYGSLRDLWLEAGTPLTEDILPAEKREWLMDEGVSRQVTLPVRWTIPEGESAGEVTLTGVYLDENGGPLLSVQPLTLTVHWYTPETIVITDTVWIGDKSPTVQMYVNLLPEDAGVWAEYSEDDGASWTRLELLDCDAGALCCIISPPDNTPRLYRLAAESRDGTRHWVSDSVLLPEEDTEDQGGNRGGSIDPLPPEREPDPPDDGTASEPDDDPAPSRGSGAARDPVRPHGSSEPSSPPEPEAPAVTEPDPQEEPQPLEAEPPESPDAETGPEDGPQESSAAGTKPEGPSDVEPAPVFTETAEEQGEAPPAPESSPAEIPSGRAESDAPDPAPPERAEDDPAGSPAPPALQAALGAAALAGCALAGIGIARLLSVRKKKK